MARRVVDLRSRLEDAARRFPKEPVRPDPASAPGTSAEGEGPEREASAGPDPAPPGSEIGMESERATAEPTANTGRESRAEDVPGDAPGSETIPPDASAPEPDADAGASPAPRKRATRAARAKSPKRARRQTGGGKRGRAAVTKAAATAAGTLGDAPSKPRARRRSGGKAAAHDPFSARLRTLEREIEDALREVGGDGPGMGGALQQTGEQLLAFYADLARALVDGGIEAVFVRLRMIGTADVVDEFGFDEGFHARVEPILRFLHDRWWRVESSGIRHVPRTGRVMLVANHSGGVMPYDGLMIAHALEARRAGRGRAARPLVEDGAYHFPFAGSPLARLGVVRASVTNAERLLDGNQAIVVFPEGAKGSQKYYRDRYRLQRFARGGFASLALRTATPLVPVAVVGAEEIYPVLQRWRWLARVLGVPDFPVTPTFPWLGLLGLIPLPSKWRLVFGKPIDLAAEYGSDAYDDELLVNRVKESVRERIQRMVIDALRERDSVFTG